MAWSIGRWHQHEKGRVDRAIKKGPAAIQTLIDDYEARYENNVGAGESDWGTLHGNMLWNLYKAGGQGPGEPYEGRNDYIKNVVGRGGDPLGYGEWKPGQKDVYFDEETGESSAEPPEGYEGPDLTERKQDWREMSAPPNWLKSMASKDGGELQLQFMAMENAMAGRAAAVDQLTGFDEEMQEQIGQPVISPEDEQEMLAMSSGTIAQGYENQRLGATHAMGMRGIDPRSGVNQELMASMRFGALAEQAQTDIGTRLQNKQINRGALERAIGLRTGIQGGIADLMAGQPLAATSMAAASSSMVHSANMADLAYDMGKPKGVLGSMQAGAVQGSQAAGGGIMGIAGGAINAPISMINR